MNVIFFDGQEWGNLRPLTLTKPLGELRMGILTFKERWLKLLKIEHSSYLTQNYLSEKYTLHTEDINYYINPAYFPNPELLLFVQKLYEGQTIWYGDQLIAARISHEEFLQKTFSPNRIHLKSISQHINQLWDLFAHNDYAIKFDFDLITQNRQSQPISTTNGVINPENIFIEEGATVEFAILNAKDGPIYIGENAEIMEGSMIRGSLALCENAKLNLGTKIYSGTTIGPWCKAGGEINNSIMMGYSNKGHEGFLGNSVIGEWCNLGADTNNSNLKNNYSEVKLWNYTQKAYISTQMQFCGLLMGDYSKTAINSQFNTGTVVGVSANVFDSGFPPKFIPSYSWGGYKNSTKFELEKAIEAIEKMMIRRNKNLTEQEIKILNNIYKLVEY